MWILTLVRGAELAEGGRTRVQMVGDGGRCVLGRDPGCDWHLPDRTLGLSARHCELASAGGAITLKDLSTNGTFVNGATQRMPGEAVLRSGDRFSAGPYQVELLFDAADAVGAAPTAPAAAAARPAAPRRGGDPAAMLGDDWEQAPGIIDDAGLKTGLTRIARPPPRSAAAPVPTAPMPMPEMLPSPSVVPPVVPSVVPSVVPPVVPASPGARTDWRAALAQAAGLPADSLVGVDEPVLAARAGRLLRALADELTQQQARRAGLGLPSTGDDAARVLRTLLTRE